MTYSKKDFSKDLEAQLNLGYEPKRIGSWAHKMFLEHCRRIDDELEETMVDLFVLEEGPQFELPESELRELVAELRGPRECPPQTESQYQLWKSMIDAIDSSIDNDHQYFSNTVDKLEKALDPSEFKNIDLISKWYEFWAPLEHRRATEGDAVNKEEAIKELLAMKDFLLNDLDTEGHTSRNNEINLW